MNLEQFSNLAQILEAVIVVVSLLYLALQVKQNTQTTRAAAAQAQIEAYSSVISSLAQSKDAARSWYLGVQDVHKLKDEQVVMFYAQVNMFFRMVESSFYQHKNGALDPELWEGLGRLGLLLYNQKGMRQYMEVREHLLSKEFRDWLKERAAENLQDPSPYAKPE